MQFTKIHKYVYLGAVALFATSALALAHPVTSHADSTPSKDDVASIFGLEKDQYGLTDRDYNHYDRSAFAKSSLPFNNKNILIGMSDGLNNLTIDKTNYTNGYLDGYVTGQVMAQGWLHYVKYGDAGASNIPYTESATGGNSTDDAIRAAYYGYKDGLHIYDNMANGYQNYTPSDDAYSQRVYSFAYKKAHDDSMIIGSDNGHPALSHYLHNSTPLGFSIDDTKGLDYAKTLLHSSDIYGGGSTTDVPANVTHVDFSNPNVMLNQNNVPVTDLSGDAKIAVSYDNPSNQNTSVSTSSDTQTTTPAVVKHVVKTTKHTKVVKKHVTKKQVKKAKAKLPKFVYAKHRTGVHSVPQFNKGKTYYVAKGHKFRVYAKVSDGHGNWRYKVGKHAYVTTIPGSISKKYVKPATKKHVKHHVHHVAKKSHKHHR